MSAEKGNIMIPDGDMPGWIKTLRDGGFSDKEIDDTLSRKNVEYAKGAGIDPVERELERIEKDMREKHNIVWDKEQREYMRKSIASRPEFKDFKEKE